MPSRMHAFFIESPARVPESGWLSTHPTVEERIRALVEFAGGRDLPYEPPAVAADAGFLADTPSDPPEQGPWG
jgi:heat shock protein HtpX